VAAALLDEIGAPMIPPRRQLLRLMAGAAVLPAFTRIAGAQTYPSRPVHIVVGLPPGLTPDIGARLIAQSLSQRLGQQFIVDNKPGGASNLATELVVRAAPDGYTLLLTVAGNAIEAPLYANLNFDFLRDIVAVASIGRTPFVMVVPPSLPARTVAEFIAYAKANPGKINFGSPGSGSANHVFVELFRMMTGVELVHVPYRSSMLPDLLAGRIQLLFAAIPGVLADIRAGKLRALAVTTATRVAALPDVPAMREFVPGYEASGWLGIGAPKATPDGIIKTLNKDISAAVADPAVKARLIGLGIDPFAMTPDAFGKFIASEVDKWAKVVKFAGIKPE
jgi:tripartite-type tricarboxylate transporter receptor subunit TctC